MEFRKSVYCTGHRSVSSHIVACDGVTQDQLLGEDILYQVPKHFALLLHGGGVEDLQLSEHQSSGTLGRHAGSLLAMHHRMCDQLVITYKRLLQCI